MPWTLCTSESQQGNKVGCRVTHGSFTSRSVSLMIRFGSAMAGQELRSSKNAVPLNRTR